MKLRKSTFINSQVYNQHRVLFGKIEKVLGLRKIDYICKLYMCNIENMLRIKGEHKLANSLYS